MIKGLIIGFILLLTQNLSAFENNSFKTDINNEINENSTKNDELTKENRLSEKDRVFVKEFILQGNNIFKKTNKDIAKILCLLSLSDSSFEKMKNNGIPSDIILKLSKIKKKNYSGMNEFIYELKRVLSPESINIYKDAIIKSALTYPDNFLNANDLQQIKYKLTRFYVKKGYINSLAIIPEQSVTNGSIKINIIEGTLTKIEITGNKSLKTSFIKKRLSSLNELINKPLNVFMLEEKIKDIVPLLKNDRRIENVHVKLIPGSKIGSAICQIQITEAKQYNLIFTFNNHNPPGVGSYEGNFSFLHNNLTGYGDSVNVDYGITEGIDDYSFEYNFELLNPKTRVFLRVEQIESEIITDPFDKLDISSETTTYSFTIRHALYQTLFREFAMGLIFEKRQSKTYLFDMPYYSSYSEPNGETNASILRCYQEWIYRSTKLVAAIRSTVNIGLDVMDATIHESDNLEFKRPDAKYVSWLGQFQIVKKFKTLDSQLIFKTDLNFSNDALLPMEKIAIGGASTVRGYRENKITTDNAVISSIEWRVPLGKLQFPVIKNEFDDGKISICPFFDFGKGTNTDSEDLEISSIYSCGLGFIWSINKKIFTQIYFAKNLRKLHDIYEHDIQDDGIHFIIQSKFF